MPEEENIVHISKEARTMRHVHGPFCLVALWESEARM